MSSDEILRVIRNTGVIAILRARTADQLLDAADAIQAGGVKAIEVTLTTSGALSLIEQAAARYTGEVIFGAGTVLDAESARLVILSGAKFVVSPGLKLEVIEICRRYSVPVFPGAFTPTEIMTAWEAGADMVKIFPASLGGPGLIKALKAPFPQVEMVPVGGVTIGNTAQFIQAGAAAVGVGNDLLEPRLLEARDWATLTARAARFIVEVQCGRNGT